MKVELRRDMSPLTSHNMQEADDRSLVPVPNNIPPAMSGTNRLGNLEVSQCLVQFPGTRVGKTSEQTIDISNTGADTFRWMFSSFASAYMRKVCITYLLNKQGMNNCKTSTCRACPQYLNSLKSKHCISRLVFPSIFLMHGISS